jgi:hypothetical protein
VAIKVALEAKVRAAQAALDTADAAVKAERAHVAKVDADLEAEGVEPFTSGPRLGELEKVRDEAQRSLNMAKFDLQQHLSPPSAPAATTPPPASEPAALESDTGHYDDGHGFGWKQPAKAGWKQLTDSSTIDPLVREAEEHLKQESEERAEGKPISRNVVIGGLLAVALLVAVAIPLVLGGSDKDEPAAVASDEEADEAPPSSVIEEPPAAPAAAGPIRYESNCTGGECFTVDMATCVWTFHFDLTILDDPEAYVGQTAVIETTGFGLDPLYEVTVASGGSVVLDATAETGRLGGTPQNGCAVDGAHYTAFMTSVGGQPTFTPDPPP